MDEVLTATLREAVIDRLDYLDVLVDQADVPWGEAVASDRGSAAR
ncbi:MAG: hypothetical protein ACRDRZ_07155 [Pseudonocardiaceae bacterium]